MSKSEEPSVIMAKEPSVIMADNTGSEIPKIASSGSTSSSNLTPIASGDSKRSNSRGRSSKSKPSDTKRKKTSKSRGKKKEVAVIVVKLKKSFTDQKISSEDKLPIIRNKSCPAKLARKPSVRMNRTSSAGKFIDNSFNDKNRKRSSRVRQKSIGIGNKSKVIWRKQLKENAPGPQEEESSHESKSEITPQLDTPIEQSSSKENETSFLEQIETSKKLMCDDKISHYFKDGLKFDGGTKENEVKKQNDRLMKHYELPSLIDTESHSITCADSTLEEYDEDNNRGKEKTSRKKPFFRSRNKKRTEQKCVSADEGEILPEQNEISISDHNIEAVKDPVDENQDPANENAQPSDMLMKGAYYLGDKADNILSKAFSNSMNIKPALSFR